MHLVCDMTKINDLYNESIRKYVKSQWGNATSWNGNSPDVGAAAPSPSPRSNPSPRPTHLPIIEPH